MSKPRHLIVMALACLLAFSTAPALAEDQVTITDQGDYYQVIIDLTGGHTLADIAVEYINDVRAINPAFESLGDSYIADFIGAELADILPAQLVYGELISRCQDFLSQLPEEYRQALETSAEQLSGGTDNVMGDGKLSFDEAMMLNLITDVARPTACSAVAVWGSRSATGNTLATRNCEWEPGNSNQLAQLHAVTTIRDGERSLCMVGWLGFFAAVTVMNDDGIFAAILDSETGAAYSSSGKRSYVFDLLIALRDYSTIEEVAAFLTDDTKQYAFNHNIFFADATRAMVLENNFSGFGTGMRRALRESSSVLRDGVSWGFDNAICTVNSFLLDGNSDNHNVPYNTIRWERFKEMMGAAGDTVGADALKAMAGDGGAGDNTCIYQSSEIHSVIVDPAAMTWEIFFRPASGEMPATPNYQSVPVTF